MAVPITVAIANELRSGVSDVIRQAAAAVTGNQGNYIKNGDPGSIYGKAQLATARQYCRRYADNPGVYSGRAKVLAENACRPYLDDIGYGTPGSIKVPFQGGQCSALYRSVGTFDFDVLICSTGAVAPGSIGATSGFTLQGPLSNLRVTTDSPGACGPRRINLLIDTVAGTRTLASFLNPSGNSPRNGRFNGVFEVAAGGSNNCGSPPPIIVDPTPPSTPGPRYEPFSPSPDINIDIGVEINPDLTINIDFGDGGGDIDPFADDDGGGGGGGGGRPPGDVGEPGSPEGTGPGGDAEGEAPEGKVLTGLKVEFESPPIGANEYAPGVYRGVCYVYMGTGEGLDHDPAGAMLRDGQFIFAEKDNLTKWRVSANLGYDLRVTPYYAAVEA